MAKPSFDTQPVGARMDDLSLILWVHLPIPHHLVYKLTYTYDVKISVHLTTS